VVEDVPAVGGQQWVGEAPVVEGGGGAERRVVGQAVEQPPDIGGREQRQVGGQDQHRIGLAGGSHAGGYGGDRPASRLALLHELDPGDGRGPDRPDDQQPGAEGTGGGQHPVEHGSSAHVGSGLVDGSLVGPAHPPGRAPGQDQRGRTPHRRQPGVLTVGAGVG